MAYLALNTFAGTGGLMQVELSFAGYNPSNPSAPAPYFDVANIKAVVVTPATATTVESEVAIALTKINTMTFKTVTAVPVGKNLRVYRETNINTPIVDFISLQVVTELDLDNSARQTLYAVMEAKDQAELAGMTADSASVVATAANVAAAAAVVTANAAATAAGGATTTANAALTAANSAVGTANAASGTAGLALTTANQASADAAAVLGVANAANTTANQANATANAAAGVANGISTTANQALTTANTAAGQAASALNTANGIAATANQASTDASQATNTANTALSTANGIAGTANQAQADASAALTAANAANTRTTSDIAEGTNLYHTQNRVRATALTSLPALTNAAITVTDTILQAFAKVQGQINNIIASFYTKAQVDANSGTRGRSINFIDNSSFAVNQRNSTSLTNSPPGVYSYDRWKTSGAGNVNSFVTGVTTSPEGMTFIGINSGQMAQVIDMEKMAGGTYTLSQASSATLTLQRNGVTIATLVGAGQVTFTFDRVGATSLILYAAGGNLHKPQLEFGTVATPWNPKPYIDELLQCKRYLQRVYGLGINTYQPVAGAYYSFRVQWQPAMAATPALVAQAPAWSISNVTSWATDGPTITGFRVLVQGGGAVGGVAVDFGTGDFVQGSCEP